MKYKLVPGKWCSECCFGENNSGIIVCLKHNKQCLPGETVYKEVFSTNGDRIRAMSNEELAKLLYPSAICPPSLKGNCPVDKNGFRYTCEQCWLQWIKQEAKEE